MPRCISASEWFSSTTVSTLVTDGTCWLAVGVGAGLRVVLPVDRGFFVNGTAGEGCGDAGEGCGDAGEGCGDAAEHPWTEATLTAQVTTKTASTADESRRCFIYLALPSAALPIPDAGAERCPISQPNGKYGSRPTPHLNSDDGDDQRTVPHSYSDRGRVVFFGRSVS